MFNAAEIIEHENFMDLMDDEVPPQAIHDVIGEKYPGREREIMNVMLMTALKKKINPSIDDLVDILHKKIGTVIGELTAMCDAHEEVSRSPMINGDPKGDGKSGLELYNACVRYVTIYNNENS